MFGHFLKNGQISVSGLHKSYIDEVESRVGQIFFPVDWVELVVELTKLSHWGLVPANFLLWIYGEQQPQSLQL